MGSSFGDFENWLDAYGAAWEASDAREVVELFEDRTEYCETPFAEPMVGRDGIYHI